MRSLLVLAALLVSACVKVTPPSRSAAGASLWAPASPNRARVVFLRETEDFGRHSHSTYPLHVVDERGELLGDLYRFTWFAVEETPGEHTFFAWHDNYANAHSVAVLHATLLPGHTYYVGAVRAESAGPLQTAERLDLRRAPAPLDGERGMKPIAMSPIAASAWSEEEKDVVAERMASGRMKIAAGDFGELKAGDGFVADASMEPR